MVAPPLRPSKFTLPGTPDGYLKRRRLIDFLHQNINRKLVLIAAAAGYGKTSLVADFARETDFPFAWLALDEGDRDLATLTANVVASLSRHLPSAWDTTQALLASSAGEPPEPELLAATLAGDLDRALNGYLVLCLDDYHLIADSEPVVHFLTRLLNLLPDQAHLIINSRAIPAPPFPIVHLAARQEIAGLSEEQLRFSGAEIQALLRISNNVSMPEAEAEKLASDTEGWITGILLGSHLMWQGLVASWLQAQQAGQPVYDYLTEEVLNRLEAGLRQFLLESAVVPDMDAEVCDYVLERTDSAHMLATANSQRLFITGVGEEAPSFRYHQLFREFLLKHLSRKAPERLRTLQRRAAGWYKQQGWHEAAVTFYLAAGDVAEAATIAEANAPTLFATGRLETLRHWGEQLAEAAGETPRLLLYLSKMHTDSGNLEEATSQLEAATQVFRQRGDQDGLVSAAVQRGVLVYRKGDYASALELARQAANDAAALQFMQFKSQADRWAGLSHFAMGDLVSAESALESAAEYFRLADKTFDLALTLQDLSRVFTASGKTARAAQAQQESLGLWRKLGKLGSLAVILNNIAWDKHMLGHYQDALATYAEALDMAKRAGAGPAEILVLTGQGDLMADLGNFQGAATHYQRALDLAQSLGEVGYLSYLYRAYARLDRWTGNYAGALEWLRRADLAPASGQAESPGINTNCQQAAVWIELGRSSEAVELLETTCASLAEAGAAVDLAASLFCLAHAYFQTGQQVEAFAALRRSFAVAEQVGYDQMLVVEALPARILLEAAQSQPDIQRRAQGLLARAIQARVVLPQERARQHDAARPGRAGLEVHALGAGRVLRQGREVPRSAWASQQPRELFFYVVDHGTVRREELLGLFWKNKSPARATANLNQALYQARRAVGRHAIVVEDGTYALASDIELDYDVAHFEECSRLALGLPPGDTARADELSSAGKLYEGEYLLDLPTDWAERRRHELSELRLEVLRQHAAELMRLVRWSEARQILTDALAVDPLADDLHGMMMRCLAALGRRSELVDHYQQYRHKLSVELGLDPSKEVSELYSRLIE
jgi:LuxR family maltose regulon positive regulatory protein